MSFAEMLNAPKIKTAAELKAEAAAKEAQDIRNAIAAEVLALGVTVVKFDSSYLKLTVDGIECSMYADVERARVGYGWHKTHTGPWAITVGNYGDRTRLGGGKNGIDPKKAAAKIVEKAKSEIATDKRNAEQRTRDKDLNAAVKRIVGDSYSWNVEHKHGSSCIQFKFGGTEEQVKLLYDFAKAQGLIK